jgi:hypothetical protein
VKKTAFVRKRRNSRKGGGYITELFSAANPFAQMRSLARVYSDMHSQCAPLDEGLGAVGTFEGPFICVNALVPREVRSTAKRFCTAFPITGKRSCLLLIGMLHIDQLKNVHSFMGWWKRVRVKRETESGENLLTAGGGIEDEFEVNRTIEQGDAG